MRPLMPPEMKNAFLARMPSSDVDTLKPLAIKLVPEGLAWDVWISSDSSTLPDFDHDAIPVDWCWEMKGVMGHLPCRPYLAWVARNIPESPGRVVTNAVRFVLLAGMVLFDKEMIQVAKEEGDPYKKGESYFINPLRCALSSPWKDPYEKELNRWHRGGVALDSIYSIFEGVNFANQGQLSDIEKCINHFVNSPPKKGKEKQVATRLCFFLGGVMEVKTPAGFIDILTPSELIEVKTFKDWKSAIGQVITYGLYYPQHQKRIHLFGCQGQDLSVIHQQCKSLGIVLTSET